MLELFENLLVNIDDRGCSLFFPALICHKLSLIGLMQFLGVNNGAVELDSSIMGVQQEGKKLKVPLNSR